MSTTFSWAQKTKDLTKSKNFLKIITPKNEDLHFTKKKFGVRGTLNEERWPEQPKLDSTKDAYQESNPLKETVHYVKENTPDEWDSLLDRNTYWKTLRVTAWALRFSNNSLAKKRKLKKKRGPIDTDEIDTAKNCWVRRVQSKTPENLETPGWQLVRDEATNVLMCKGRIVGYQPTYLNEGPFVNNIISHTSEDYASRG